MKQSGRKRSSKKTAAQTQTELSKLRKSEQIIATVLSESRQFLTGDKNAFKTSRTPGEQFQGYAAALESGCCVNVFCDADDIPLALICSSSFADSLFDSWVETHRNNIPQDDPAVHYTRDHILTSLLSSLTEWAGIHNDPQEGWQTGPAFPLPADFEHSALVAVFWKYADYLPFMCQVNNEECYVLLSPDFSMFLEKALTDESYIDYISQKLLRRVDPGNPDSEEIYPHMITLNKEYEFELGPYLFPAQVDLGSLSVTARYNRIAVGPVFPATGLIAGWKFTCEDENQTTFDQFFVFPTLEHKKAHIDLVKTLIARSTRYLAEFIASQAPMPPVKTQKLNLTRSFQWHENQFVLEVLLSIGKREIPLWIYASVDYVKYLTEILKISVSWDIRERSTRSFILTLLNFTSQVFDRKLVGQPPGKHIQQPSTQAPDMMPSLQEQSTEGQGDHQAAQSPNAAAYERITTLNDLLVNVTKSDRMKIIQLFLLGKLAYSAETIRKHFYYMALFTEQEEAVSVLKKLPGFNEYMITEHLTSRVLSDWKAKKWACSSLEELKMLNHMTLKHIFHACLADNLEVSFRTRHLLNQQFLKQHNDLQKRRIQGIVESDSVFAMFEEMHKGEIQSFFSKFPTKNLALAWLADPRLKEYSHQHISRTLREDADFFHKLYSEHEKLNIFDWENARISIEALTQKTTDPARIQQAKNNSFSAYLDIQEDI